jgi:RNA polymerase sigma factor for flagellar operon FliA
MFAYSETKTYQKAAAISAGPISQEARDNLILTHLPKVKYITDRIAARLPSFVERDDLYGAGVVGLIDAVERFDASRGVAFTTFAEQRVRGAILDNLRSFDWASRTVRRRAREIQAAFSELEQKSGGTVSEEDVAAHMNIPIAELRETLQEIRGLKITNLDERDAETGFSVGDLITDNSISPLDEVGNAEYRLHLARAIDKLPERERQVIALYYAEELTMKEIGEVLGVTESRVSQLRSQAMVRLRSNLPK